MMEAQQFVLEGVTIIPKIDNQKPSRFSSLLICKQISLHILRTFFSSAVLLCFFFLTNFAFPFP